jgi:hypothetical protein
VGIESGSIHIRSEIRIADATQVAVWFDHIQLSGAVTGCQPMGDDWGVSVALGVSRRREVRLSATEHLTVGIVGERGTTACEAAVVNASPSGLGLSTNRPMKLATRIYIETEAEMLLGEVRHCRPTGEGRYSVGVMIVDVVPDARSQGKFSAFWERFRWKLASSVAGKNSSHW